MNLSMVIYIFIDAILNFMPRLAEGNKLHKHDSREFFLNTKLFIMVMVIVCFLEIQWHKETRDLPNLMTLASGGRGSPIFPLVVHQPASPSIWPSVQSLWLGLSRGDNVGAVEDMMCVVYASVGYFEVHIALIFCWFWSEPTASCFVWI